MNKKNFQKSFENLSKTGNETGMVTIVVGYCYAIENRKFLVDYMNKWVEFIDEKLHHLMKGTREYADVFGQRAFTYDEFRRVLETNISEGKEKRQLEYDYLYLDDAIAVEEFKFKYARPELSMREAYALALKDTVEQEIPNLYRLLCETKLKVKLPLKKFFSHVYAISRSNTGKSEIIKYWLYQLIYHTSIIRSSSAILIEPHRDLSHEVLRFAVHRGHFDRVVYLDPNIRQTADELIGEHNLGAQYAFSINPFDVGDIPRRHVGFMTEHISKAFFDIIKSEETFQMESIIEACVETLILRSGSDILDLKRFMNDDENADLISFAKQHLRGEKRNLMMERFSSDPKIQGTKSSIYYRLQSILGKEVIVNLLSGRSTVNFGKLMDEGKIIICNFSKAALGPIGGPLFGKLVTSLISGYMTLRQFKRKSDRKPNFLFMDEFQNYVHEGTTEYLFAEQRKFGNYLICANQQMGQNMSSEIRRVVSGNVGIKIMGPNEPDSVEWMTKQMRNLEPEAIFNLPEYSFYFNDSSNKHLGTFIMRVPDYLVDDHSKYYLRKEELKKLLIYQATKSGYYRPTNGDEILPEAPQDKKLIKTSKTFQHNFTQ